MEGGRKWTVIVGVIAAVALVAFVVSESGYAPAWLTLIVTRIIQILSRL